MSANFLFVILATLAAAFYLGVLVYAAYRSNIKRKLYLLKAVLMLYFIVLGLQRMTDYTYLSLSRLFIPTLAVLFATQAVSALIDAYRRG